MNRIKNVKKVKKNLYTAIKDDIENNILLELLFYQDCYRSHLQDHS